MIQARKTAGPLPYTVVWFAQPGDEPALAAIRSPLTVLRQASPDVVAGLGAPVLQRRTFCTGVADLTLDTDVLQGRMNRTCRYQVRRGLHMDHGFEVGRVRDLPEARALVDAFYRRKFGRAVGRVNWAFADAHGCASLVRHAGEVVAANIHIVDGLRRARTLYGATVERQPDGALSSQTISILNRLLSWLDMLHFKDLGVALYDAGGLFDDPAHPAHGIDEFKLSFGLDRRYEVHALSSPWPLARHGLALLGRGA